MVTINRLHKSLIMVMAARIADQLTTDAGLRMGFTEANPHINLGYGVPILVLSFIMFDLIHRHRIIDLIMYSFALSMWIAFANNMMVILGVVQLELWYIIPLIVIVLLVLCVREGFIIVDWNMNP